MPIPGPLKKAWTWFHSGPFREGSRARRMTVGIIGGVVLAVGVAGLVLPGPGLLLMFVGIALLATEFEWADRRVDYIRDKAFEAAEYGVRTWPRIVASTLGGLSLLVIGVIWIIGPEIPEIWIFGPELPFQGVLVGLTLILSSFIALGLMVYSYRKFRSKQAAAVASDDQAASDA